MTAGDLYEKCVALGLCERAKWLGAPLCFTSTPPYVGEWALLRSDGGVFGDVNDDEAEDLCAMSVMRALEQRGLLSTYARVHKINLKLLADFLIRHASAC